MTLTAMIFARAIRTFSVELERCRCGSKFGNMFCQKKTFQNSSQIYRSVEMRPKVLMRADSTSAAASTKATDADTAYKLFENDGGERIFRTMKDVSKCLRSIFQTQNTTTLCIGHCRNEMETVILNFIDDGDTVLVGVIGETGKEAAEYIRKIGARVHTVKGYVGQILQYDDIESQLKSLQPNVFFVVHGESSTGVLQPIEKLGKLCQKYNCLLIIDAINTLGAVELCVDKWNIDVTYGTSQKALGSEPGLIPISIGARGMAKLEKRRTHLKSLNWDIRRLAKAWLLFDESNFLYSEFLEASCLYALRDNLHRIRDEGLPNVIERHFNNSKRLQDSLEKKIGLELFVEQTQHRLPTIVAIRVPNSINDRLFTKYLSERHLLEISPGWGGTMGQIFRIGLMNANANKEVVDNVLQAFYEALKSMVPNYIDQYQYPNVYY